MDQPTAKLLHGVITAIFISTWILLAIAGALVSRNLDAATKRRWQPYWVVFIGVLFAIFATTLTVLASRSLSSLAILIILVPAIAFTCYINIKFMKFCDNCGEALYSRNWFDPKRFCSKCGAPLVQSKPPRGDSLLE
jgi:hypothetical protein